MSAPDKIIASFHGHCAIDGKTYPYGPWFAVYNPLRSSGVEYVRLDHNTRVVTVDQLERWQVIIDKLAPGFVYGSGPYNETLPEITGMWNEIRALIVELM
jgi:hypothetical protein